jgi:hypothetical protein
MNLNEYKKHLLNHGPEQLVETARKDPDMVGHVVELEAAIVKWHRQFIREDGKRKHRRDPVTKKPKRNENVVICACGCGRDVPKDRTKTMGRNAIYFNNACKQRAYRQRAHGQPR